MSEEYVFRPWQPGMVWGPHMHRHPCPETDRVDALLNGTLQLPPDPPRFKRLRLPDVSKNSFRKFLTSLEEGSK